LSREISRLLARIDILEGRSTARTSHARLDAEALRTLRARLPEDQQIVEFFIGSERSWAWILSRNSLTMVPLPSAQVVRPLVDRTRKALTQPATRRTAGDAVHELSQTIIAPLAAHLTGKRLLIVADGPLLYVPFQQLLESAEMAAVDHAMLPSLSVLLMPPPSPRPKSVRAALFSQSQAPGDSALPAVELEVAAIESALGRNQVTLIRGAALNRTAFKSFAFAGYDVVHIASHAENDDTDASLSRLLIGHSADDVLLAADINQLRIPVRLVVLSGCETALGTDLPGNGVGGFAQAFMVAGAETVIASLWNIPDAAAAELMKHFYAALTATPANPQRALAIAQAALRRGSQWRHPFYWSGFVTITRVL
jgi:CHAT domain-containing protein